MSDRCLIARELAGFVWAIACITSDPPVKASAVAPASEEVGSTSRRMAIVSSRNNLQRRNEVARPGMRQEHRVAPERKSPRN